MGSLHVIRIPDREARARAIKALMEVPFGYRCLPNNIFGILTAHLDALKKEQIPYEDLSRPKTNGKAEVQS